MNISIGDKVTFSNSGRVRFGIVSQLLFETNQCVIVETDENWNPTRFVWTLSASTVVLIQALALKDAVEEAYTRAMRGL